MQFYVNTGRRRTVANPCSLMQAHARGSKRLRVQVPLVSPKPCAGAHGAASRRRSQAAEVVVTRKPVPLAVNDRLLVGVSSVIHLGLVIVREGTAVCDRANRVGARDGRVRVVVACSTAAVRSWVRSVR